MPTPVSLRVRVLASSSNDMRSSRSLLSPSISDADSARKRILVVYRYLHMCVVVSYESNVYVCMISVYER